ncbi:hypothetical protein AVEN_124928-1 [Araneus ventricosus]|uniref:Uncharacterized protein n=1 Tax=Araneus ventricosus TaxID=182803 RepID=A0A4Y2TFV2_ARAVE|nr:hypothetical protein AVEN_124928-1 [Araneus ventricosus]
MTRTTLSWHPSPNFVSQQRVDFIPTYDLTGSAVTSSHSYHFCRLNAVPNVSICSRYNFLFGCGIQQDATDIPTFICTFVVLPKVRRL